jgi:hypothetical protein
LLASSCNARVHVEKYQAGRIQAVGQHDDITALTIKRWKRAS